MNPIQVKQSLAKLSIYATPHHIYAICKRIPLSVHNGNNNNDYTNIILEIDYVDVYAR